MAPTEERLRALGRHLVWVLDFLHHHHEGEDERLYPLVRGKNPAAGRLLDEMGRDHASILAPMGELVVAAEAASNGEAPLPDRVARLEVAVDALRTALYPHLEREELTMMPVVAECITRAEWEAYEDSNTKMSKRELAFLGHWILDGLADDLRPIIIGVVPPVPRFVLLHLMGGAYRKLAHTLWAGTPAAALRSEPLSARPGVAEAGA